MLSETFSAVETFLFFNKSAIFFPKKVLPIFFPTIKSAIKINYTQAGGHAQNMIVLSRFLLFRELYFSYQQLLPKQKENSEHNQIQKFIP